ncbi:hypothetical protein MMC11_002974 [Xylographa trunciseda]|nr:hypothetical protein [Xylographa trunciseda]
MNTNVSSSDKTNPSTSPSQTSQQPFRQLGFGSCGTVFVHHDPLTVPKQANNDDNSLWNDYTMQLNVHAQFSREQLIDTFCPAHGIPGAKSSAGNADCIARLYLGRRRQPRGRPQQFFSLRNFSLHLDMVDDLGLDVEAYAAAMAAGLAVCHWRARVDANDVEFVLGSKQVMKEARGLGVLSWEQVAEMPVNSNTIPGDAGLRGRGAEMLAESDVVVESAVGGLDGTVIRLWMLDYDKCHAMEWSNEGVRQAVVAVEANDPYFPKPHKERVEDQGLWENFKEAYLRASEVIMVEDEIQRPVLGLPRKFLGGIGGFQEGEG